jgi:hypothetical protein
LELKMSKLCGHTEIKEVCYTSPSGVRQTLLAHYTYAPSAGAVKTALVRTVITNALSVPVDTTGGTVTVGSCELVRFKHVFDWRQVIPAGSTVLTHNLGLSGYATLGAGNVQVRNAATGAEIAVRVTAYTANTITIVVPVATPLAIITFTGSDK